MTQKNIFAMLFSFVMAVVLILAITCPWFLHFQGEFLDHWDPPFHAWKLEFIAKRILAGDWFVQTTNTNMLYPYSGTFYYEALQWPPALFAAALFKFTTMPSELIYHVTLIVFWWLKLIGITATGEAFCGINYWSSDFLYFTTSYKLYGRISDGNDLCDASIFCFCFAFFMQTNNS